MKIISAVSLLLLLLLGFIPNHGFESGLWSAVKPYHFSVAAWEAGALTQQVGQFFRGRDKQIDTGTDTVTEYLVLGSQIQTLEVEISATDGEELRSKLIDLEKERDDLRGAVEIIIKRQIQQALTEQNIFNPWYEHGRPKLDFPPVELKLETPPHLLVVSRRDRIETIKTILLDEDLGLETMTNIEGDVDKLNVSSLVVDLGGLATYPCIVDSDASLQFIIETAAHEWAHEYLAFTPLGFQYLLNIAGLSQSYDIVTMNETVADIVGKEIGDIVIQRYYTKALISMPPITEKKGFDFDREMREIRKTVDQYFARGEIETAEKFMQEKHDYLETMGYNIRKLNQAYFAFNGQYSDKPAFVSPIGTELNELRAKSASLGDFLKMVGAMKSREDLSLAPGNH